MWRLQACKTQDLKTLDQIFDDAIGSVDQDGELMTKADVLLNVQTINSLEYLIDTVVVRLHGNTAIVTGLYQLKVRSVGSRLCDETPFVDTWLYRNDRWVAMASVSVPAD